MRKTSTWMLEKGTQTPSPSPDHIPAEDNNKTLTGNSRELVHRTGAPQNYLLL